MNAGPTLGLAETNIGKNNEKHICVELASIITKLIDELKEAQNAKIDLLHEKIKRQDQENEILKNENERLKHRIIIQENIQQQQPDMTNNPMGLMTYAQVLGQQNQQTTKTETKISKQRGIRAHNLIITCSKSKKEDPKKVVEDIFINKCGKKPKITAVQLISSIDQISNTEQEQCKLLVTVNSNLEAK